MKTSHKVVILLAAFLMQLSVYAQEANDLTSKKIKEVLSETNKNGGCAFFDFSLANVEITNPNCAGETNGMLCVDLDAITPVDDYIVVWSGPEGHPQDGAMTECIGGLGASTWTVAIFNSAFQGCGALVEIAEPAVMTVLDWGIPGITLIPPSCFGNCDGQVNPLVFGGPGDGSGPFNYLYSSGETTPNGENLCDPFTLTLEDSNGCIREIEYDFEDGPQEILADSIITNTCFGEMTGSIDLTVTGGNPFPGANPYNFVWTGITSTDEDVFNLGPGIYSVEISDASPCTITREFVIEESEPIVTDPVLIDVFCFGDNSGEIMPNASGGIGLLTYLWTGPNVIPTNENQINLPAGDFTLTTTDSLGCFIIDNFTLNPPDSIAITGVETDVSCFGDNDGSITLNVTGGSGIYVNFQWDTPACYSGITNVSDITGLCAGIYDVTVTDSDGCQILATFEILEPDEINVDLTKMDVSCFGEDDGSIISSITGGSQPTGIPVWNNPPTIVDVESLILNNLAAGEYVYTYLDENSCEASGAITIFEEDEIIVEETIEDATCGTESDGSISLSITGGVQAYDIVWSTGGTEIASNVTFIEDLPSGTYDFDLTDADGCSFNDSYIIEAPGEILIDVENVDSLSCFGGNDAAIDVSFSGGGGPGTYTPMWTGPVEFTPQNTEDIQNLTAGTYTLVVSSGECTSQDIFIIEPKTEIELTFVIDSISCQETCDGAINMDITGGTMPYQSIIWTGPPGFAGSNLEDINDLCPGIYFVEIIDNNGCVKTGQVDLQDSETVNITGSVTNIDCFGSATGEIDISHDGPVGTTTFTWDGPSFTSNLEDISGLEAGEYNVNIDIDGCISMESFEIIENDSIFLDTEITPFPCNGNSSGAIEITVNGGTAPFEFLWDDPIPIGNNTNEDQFNLAAGTYSVVVTDSLDCIYEEVFDIDPSANIYINGIVQDVSCFGNEDGEIVTAPSGGNEPYLFDWSGPNFFSNMGSQSLMDLAPGDYMLSMTDQDGCILDTTMTIGEPLEIQIDVVTTQPSCGVNDGELSINTSNGVGVTNVAVIQDGVGEIFVFTGLGTGIYHISAVDSETCTKDTTIVLTNSEISIVIEEQTNVTCFGEATGSASISFSGAVGSVSVVWSSSNAFNQVDGNSINMLVAGEYFVTITDDNGCEAIETILIEENEAIETTVEILELVCESDANGSITVIGTTGGVPNYEYLWNGNNIANVSGTAITMLEEGEYTLTTTDDAMCSIDQTFEIEANVGLVITANITNVDCFGDLSGAIDVSVTGGLEPYDFNWLEGFDTEDLDVIPAGIYNLTVTDDNNCSQDATFEVLSNSPIFGEAILTNVLCNGDPSGAIELINLGGVQPYIFSWTAPSFNASTQNLNGVPANTYVLNISDSLGCTYDDSFEITEQEAIEFEVEIENVDCFGSSIGSLDLINSSGGTGTLVPIWSPIPDGASVVDGDLINIPAGNYNLNIMDDNGCSSEEDYTVVNANGPIETTALITNVFCSGQNDGSITIEVSGGIPGYTISWSPNGESGNTITDLAPGNYTASISDNIGCQKDTTFTIEETNPLTLDLILLEHNLCFGDGAGSININVDGGTPLYTYSWTDGNGFFSQEDTLTNLDGGVYQVVVTDFNNCEVTEEFTVEEPEDIEYTLEVVNSNCGLDDGSASVTNVTGGVAATTYSINWFSNNVPIGTGSTIEDLIPGLYSVEIIDDQDCSKTEEFTISDNVGSLVSLVTPIDCPGNANGEITVSVEGFTPEIIYSWSNTSGVISNQPTIGPLAPDTYTVTVIDALACQIVESFIIEDPEPIMITGTTLDESCPDLEDGSINVVLSGGTGDLNWVWGGSGITNPFDLDQVNLPPGIYDITVEDENSCEASDSFVIDPASEFTIEGVVSPISCFGEDDGSIAISIDFGAFPPIDDLTYSWTGTNVIQDNEDQFNLGPGEYTLTVTTPNGCMEVRTFNIDNTSEIILEVSTINSTCLMNNGSATVIGTGGEVAIDYVYSWVEGNGNILGDTDNTLNDAAAGLYTVSITDDNLCVVSQDFVISDDGSELTYDVDSVSCPGLSDGAIDITYTGMTEPVNIVWNGPAGDYDPSDEDISGLTAGEYILIITGTDGCILGDVIPVFENEFIDNSAIITNVSCNGAMDGSINITPIGGSGGYTFDWTDDNGNPVPSDVNGDVSGLEPGEYFVTINDDAMCSGSASFFITQPDNYFVVDDVIDATCFGSSDGAINLVNVSGGNEPYEFEWTVDGDPTVISTFQSIDAILAGDYSVSISDLNGCIFIDTYTVSNNDQIIATVDTTSANCGLPTGSAMVNASGGTNTFSYQWFNFIGENLGEDGNEILGLVQGQYTVEITDGNNCSIIEEFEIQNDDYSVTAEIVQVDCFDNCNGQIEITLSDDFEMPISTLSWTGPDPLDPPAASLSITDLCAGSYTLNLADNNGCPFSQEYIVEQPDSISLGTIEQDLSCYEDQSGSIVLITTGGTPFGSDPEYNFEWTVPVGDDPGNTHFAENLNAGIYNVTVTDSLNCSNDIVVELSQPEELALIALVQSPVCESDSNGSIEVSISGGTPGMVGYVFDWSNDETTATIEDLTIGEYSLNVEDANGCVLDSLFEISATIILELDVMASNVSCFGFDNGTIDVNASGGSDQFTYLWNADTDVNINNDPNSALMDLTGGEYYLTLTDTINGCVKMDTTFIFHPDSLFANIEVLDPLCFGDANGAISLETTGGTSPYNFTWTYDQDPGFNSNDSSITDLDTGNYTIEILDSNLCVKEYVLNISQPDSLFATIDEINDAFCNTSADGSINSSIFGGTPGYSVVWENANGENFVGANISNLLPGEYYLNAVDTNACFYQDTVLVNYEQEVLALIDESGPYCEQLATTLDGSQSIGANTYLWTDINNAEIGVDSTTGVILSVGYDEFILEISNGVCTSSDTLIIDVNPLPMVDAGEDLNVFPEEEIEIGGNPSGPTAINFNWSPGDLLSDSTIANPTYFNIGDQEFILNVTDANGCQNRDSVLITLINQVIIPDGFSPNGDGKNDTWVISNFDRFPEMEVKIYNRWGEKLFESVGYNTPWDGLYGNEAVPVGTYYYTIDLRDEFFPKPFTGPLTIFR